MKKLTIFVCTCCDQFISGKGFVDNLKGELKGVLCFECDRAVAVMRENTSRLKKVSNYLIRIGDWHEKDNS